MTKEKLALGEFADFALSAKQHAYQTTAEALVKLAAGAIVTGDEALYALLSNAYEVAEAGSEQLAEQCFDKDIPLLDPYEDEDDEDELDDEESEADVA
jgi:hypothetical protein